MAETNNTFTCKIMNWNGFDLPLVSELVKLVKLSLSSSTVTITRDGKTASADSPMQLMSLMVKSGDTVTVCVEGGDEEAGKETLKEFFINTFEAVIL